MSHSSYHKGPDINRSKWDDLRDRGLKALGFEAIIMPSGDFEVCTRQGLISVPGHISSKNRLKSVARKCGVTAQEFGLGHG